MANKRRAKKKSPAPPVGECPLAPSRKAVRRFMFLRRDLESEVRRALAQADQSAKKWQNSELTVSRLASQIGDQNRAVTADMLFRAEDAEMRVAYLTKKLQAAGLSPD